MNKPENPPAFPVICEANLITKGMSLRDYYAAHAPEPPSGWIGPSDDGNKNLCNLLDRPDNAIYAMIEWRWFYADHMLKEREKQS